MAAHLPTEGLDPQTLGESSLPGGNLDPSSQSGATLNSRGRAIKPTTRWEDESNDPLYVKARKKRKPEGKSGSKAKHPPVGPQAPLSDQYPASYAAAPLSSPQGAKGASHKAKPKSKVRKSGGGGKGGGAAAGGVMAFGVPPPVPLPASHSDDFAHKRPMLMGQPQEQKPPPDLLDLVPVPPSEEAVRQSQIIDENGVPIDKVFQWHQLGISQDLDARRTDRIWALASSMFVSVSPALADVLLGLHKPEAELLREDPALMVPPLGNVYRRELLEGDEYLRPYEDGSLRMLMEMTNGELASAGVSASFSGKRGGKTVAKEEGGELVVAPAQVRIFSGHSGTTPFRLRATASSEDTDSLRLQVDEGEEEAICVEDGGDGGNGAAYAGGDELNVVKLWGTTATASVKRGDKGYDLVLEDLQQAQGKLVAATRKNLAIARGLRDKVAKAFQEAQGKHKELSEMRGLIAKFRAEVAKKEEEREEELMRMQEEDMSSCAVCSSGESTSGVGRNPIVFCDKCGLAVHQRCYRIAVVPPGEWLCKSCEVQRAEGQESKNPVLRPCALCPHFGGAMVPTECKQWVHVTCAIWMGLLDDDAKVPTIEPRLVFLRRRYLEIYRCSAIGCPDPFMGGLIACMEPTGCCRNFFHVTCARNAKQEVYQGQLFGELGWKAFCREHTNPVRYEKLKKEVEVKVEPAIREDQVTFEICPQYLELWYEQEQVIGAGAGKKPSTDPGYLEYDKDLQIRKAVQENVERKRLEQQAAYKAAPPPPQLHAPGGPPPPPPPSQKAGGRGVYAEGTGGGGGYYGNGYVGGPPPPGGEGWDEDAGGPPGRFTSRYMPGAGGMPDYPDPSAPPPPGVYYHPGEMGMYPQAPVPGGSFGQQSVYPGSDSGSDMYGGPPSMYHPHHPPPGMMYGGDGSSVASGPVSKKQRGSSGSSSIPPALRVHECNGCGATFGSNSNLTRHRRESCQVLVHGKPRPKKPPFLYSTSTRRVKHKAAAAAAAAGGGGGGEDGETSGGDEEGGEVAAEPSPGVPPSASAMPMYHHQDGMWGAANGQPPPPGYHEAEEGGGGHGSKTKKAADTETAVTDVMMI